MKATRRTSGAPFFVMEYVPGVTPVLEPNYTQAGFYFDASPADRRRMTENGLRLVAELHQTDWRAAGLDWLIAEGAEPTLERQVDLWENYLNEHLGDRVHEVAAKSFAWLRANMPTGLQPSLSWGDARPGNIIWQDFEVACVTDWENVAIAPAEIDIGWWLMFDRTCHKYVGADYLEGEMSLDEQRDFFCDLAGCDPEVVKWCELFGAVRYVAIITRMMNLYVEQGKLPADQTVWLNNPACRDRAGPTCRVPLKRAAASAGPRRRGSRSGNSCSWFRPWCGAASPRSTTGVLRAGWWSSSAAMTSSCHRAARWTAGSVTR